MGQIHGDNLGSPVAIVTGKGELLTTGSIVVTSSQIFKMVQKIDEVLNEVKIVNQQLRLITDSDIKEVEIKE